MTTKEKLDKLAVYERAKTTFELESQMLICNAEAEALRQINEKLPAECIKILDEIEAVKLSKIKDIREEFATKLADADCTIFELKEQIKEDVLAYGTTVKGDYITAVFSKGRVTWDGKVLDGLAIAIPNILTARRESAPSVSFRSVYDKQ